MKHFLLLAAIFLTFSTLSLAQSGTIEINQPPTPLSVEVGQTISVNVTYSASEEMDIEATIYQLNPNGSINWGPGHGGTWTRPTFPASAGSTVNIDMNIPGNFDPDLSYGFVLQLKGSNGFSTGDYDNPIDILPSTVIIPEIEVPMINTSLTYEAATNIDFTVGYTSNQGVYFKAQLLIKEIAGGANYDHYGYYQQDFAAAPAGSTANISLLVDGAARGSDEISVDSAYVILVELYEYEAVAKGSGVSRAPQQIGFFFSDPVTIQSASAVPIKLVNFTGEKLDESSVLLKWQTALEINNDFFMVEKSSDAKSWQPFSKIQGNGNTNLQSEYSATDRNPLSGSNFYRLKQTDFDGSSTYSDAIKVNMNRFNIDLYPNPVTDKIIVTIPGKNSGNTIFQLFDVTGKLIKSGNLENEINNIDVSSLNAGNYFINIIKNNEIVQTKNLIKK